MKFPLIYTYRNHFSAVCATQKIAHSATLWGFFSNIFILKYLLTILCYCRELIIFVNTLNKFFLLCTSHGVEKTVANSMYGIDGINC